MVHAEDAELIAGIDQERWLRGARVMMSLTAVLGIFGAMAAMVGLVAATASQTTVIGATVAMLLVIFGLLLAGRVTIVRIRARRRRDLPPPTASSWPRWAVLGIGVAAWFVFMSDLPWRRPFLAVAAVVLLAVPIPLRRAEPEAPTNPLFVLVGTAPLMLWLVLAGRDQALWVLPALAPLIAMTAWSRRAVDRAREAGNPDAAITGWMGSWLPAMRKGALLAQTGHWPRATAFADHLLTRRAPHEIAQGAWIRAAHAQSLGHLDDVRTHAALAVRLDPYHVDAWLLLADHAIHTSRTGAEALVDAALRVAFRHLRTGPEIDALQQWRTDYSRGG